MSSSCDEGQVTSAMHMVKTFISDHADEITDFALDCIPVVGSVKQGFELYRLCTSEDASTLRIGIKVLSFGFSVVMDVMVIGKVFSACGAYSAAARLLAEKGGEEFSEEVAKKAAGEAINKVYSEMMRATVNLGGKAIGNVFFKCLNSKALEMEVRWTKEKYRRLQEQHDQLREEKRNVDEQLDKETRKRKRQTKELKEENRKRQRAAQQLEEESRRDKNTIKQLKEQVEVLQRGSEDNSWMLASG